MDSESPEFIKCDSCGFSEECTRAYISRIRERYCGLWLCGLCIEAVKDEVLRSGRLISTKEALNRHINVCKNFRSSPPASLKHPIFAIGKIMKKSLDSPSRSAGSSPQSSPIREINRSASMAGSSSRITFFPALSR